MYKNYGVKELLFGVSFVNLKLLKKKIKKDYDLVVELWEMKNMDVMILVIYILDLKKIMIE